MIVGVEFDDVLMPTNEALAEFHNHKYKTNYTVADIHDWELAKLWGCSGKEMKRRITEFVRTEAHAAMQPREGAVATLQALREAGHGVVVITSRWEHIRAETQELAHKHFPGIEIILADGIAKSILCHKYDVDVFVEDATHNADDVSVVVRQLLLFDRPWNRVYVPPCAHIHRVHSWSEIHEVLL